MLALLLAVPLALGTLPLHVVPPAAVPPAAVPPLEPLRVVHAFQAVGTYAAGDRGVDLAGEPGQRVVSATAGTVSFADTVAGQGVVSVRIAAGVLTYEPVRAVVHAGDAVSAGQALGVLAGGHLGCPATACLHWGLRRADGTYADPLALLGPPRVRLLPLGADLAADRARAATTARSPGDATPTGAAPTGAAPIGAAPIGAAPTGAAPAGAEVGRSTGPQPRVGASRSGPATPGPVDAGLLGAGAAGIGAGGAFAAARRTRRPSQRRSRLRLGR